MGERPPSRLAAHHADRRGRPLRGGDVPRHERGELVHRWGRGDVPSPGRRARGGRRGVPGRDRRAAPRRDAFHGADPRVARSTALEPARDDVRHPGDGRWPRLRSVDDMQRRSSARTTSTRQLAVRSTGASTAAPPPLATPSVASTPTPRPRAAADLAGAGIKTFVIGVPGSEPYDMVLDRLAVEGGTARAAEPLYYPVATSDTAALAAVFAQIVARTGAGLRVHAREPAGQSRRRASDPERHARARRRDRRLVAIGHDPHPARCKLQVSVQMAGGSIPRAPSRAAGPDRTPRAVSPVTLEKAPAPAAPRHHARLRAHRRVQEHQRVGDAGIATELHEERRGLPAVVRLVIEHVGECQPERVRLGVALARAVREGSKRAPSSGQSAAM